MYRRLTSAARAPPLRGTDVLLCPPHRSVSSASSPLCVASGASITSDVVHQPLMCSPLSSQRRAFFSVSDASRKMSELVSKKTKSKSAAAPSDTTAATPSSAKAAAVTPAAVAAPPPLPQNSHAAAQSELEAKLIELRQLYLEPYDKVYRFLNPLKSTAPMVMMLGNHSSGKSTLINYLAGRGIQETGIAPTDDGFTVIRRDSYDMDTDGPSVVSNPKYQYQSLQQFGISFVTHFKMKTRKMSSTSRIPVDMVLVDTPGMIDTPVHASNTSLSSGDAMYGSDQTRGYDFLGATRWFAQQSDVILLMFDPANPGTTGETLDVLTKSLAGYEHKFLLVMNKADLFEKVTDFARAYGTLCWNLSKVMKMKDIPRVYTTCTPLDKSGKLVEAASPSSPSSSATASDTTAKSSAAKSPTGTVPEAELSRQRNQILEEIMSAPMRRMDNLITETEDSARNLLLAVRAAKILRQDYRQREIMFYSAIGTACLVCPAAAMALSSFSLTGTALLTVMSIGVGYGGFIGVRAYLKEVERNLLDSSDYVLNRLYTSKTRTKDVELRWNRSVKPEIIRIASTYHDNGRNGITTLPTCSARVCRAMEAVVDVEVPALRRSVTEYKEAYFRGKDQGGSHHSIE